jgi:hypothetical protein
MMKTADQWAREFKLHHCIGSRKFAEQVKKIQENAIQFALANSHEKRDRERPAERPQPK